MSLSEYRKGWQALPAENEAWELYGPGLESFGTNGEPAHLHMPEFGPDELLARVDALGICFSDVKLITQGNTHPRITGRDLVANPAVPGHEVSLTIVGVGEKMKGQFEVGQRFVVQADVYYRGVNIAFGYALRGGMQQYVVLGEEVLRGDEGCYLIPLQPTTGYAEAALTEPWACVVASYRVEPRREMKPGGVALFIGPPKRPRYYPSRMFKPGKVILAGTGDSVDTTGFEDAEIIEIGPIAVTELKALSEERTGGRGFDDIIVLGRTEPELIEELDRRVARGGVVNLVADEPVSRRVTLDVGRIHYDAITYTGGHQVDDGYKRASVSELTAGGSAWFIGAAGPMGQMHVERAIQMKDGPTRILCTDVDTGRLETLRDKVGAMAGEKWIEIEFVNPIEISQEDFRAVCDELTGGGGFDDIVVLAPVPALIEQACDHLADGGRLNIFAGVPRGTMATLDVSAVYLRGAKWMGSSGSRPADLEFTLHEDESGHLDTNRSVAAIGGIEAVGAGVKAVKEALFPGKTVIFPQIADLPLTALPDLKETLPSVYEKLADGKFWTREAEEELLRLKL